MELFGLYALKHQEVVEIKSFKTKYEIVGVAVNFEEFYDESVNVLNRKEFDLQEQDSGWTLIGFLHVEINFLKFNPMLLVFGGNSNLYQLRKRSLDNFFTWSDG
ncbi:hypothetical protein FQA39_LY16294 [Lamprigera yunnana]|nr:hypothetical protein FQA39_LY16294 [Lamprigera yunnana]